MKDNLILISLRKLISITLKHPKVFEWQQKLCNSYDNVRKEFQEYYDKQGQTILDIGCSTGTFAGAIVDMENNDYFGIDINQEYIARAKQNYPKGNFLTMDASNMSFDDEMFDFITFNGVLHHMDDVLITSCLESIKSVLKKDGVILIAEPVFTKSKPLSNFLLSLDRGRYIRDAKSYALLFNEFFLKKQSYFPFSLHRFCSLIFRKCK